MNYVPRQVCTMSRDITLVGLVGLKLNTVLARRLGEWEARKPPRVRSEATRRGRRSKERLGSELTKAAVELYRSGLSLRQVAAQTNLAKTTVLEMLHRQGEPVRRPAGLLPEHIHEAIRLYESGWLLKEVASRFDVSKDDVRRKLIASGVVMRSGHGNHGRGRR